jgi:hypothetical protein
MPGCGLGLQSCLTAVATSTFYYVSADSAALELLNQCFTATLCIGYAVATHPSSMQALIMSSCNVV